MSSNVSADCSVSESVLMTLLNFPSTRSGGEGALQSQLRGVVRRYQRVDRCRQGDELVADLSTRFDDHAHEALRFRTQELEGGGGRGLLDRGDGFVDPLGAGGQRGVSAVIRRT